MLTITKHRKVMLGVLKAIYENTLLGPSLGFKGGTLLYTLYNLPRFSVDLDFDIVNGQILLGSTKERDVFEEIGNIMKKFGKVESLIIKKYTIFCLINYEKGQQGLKVEIHRGTSENKFEIKNYLGIPILAMTIDDIFANKLVALTSRKRPANRDVFDTWYMLNKDWDINWKLVETRSGLKKDKYIKKCIKLLENWPLESRLENLGELVDNKTKDWIKKNLIKDTIFLLKANYQI